MGDNSTEKKQKKNKIKSSALKIEKYFRVLSYSEAQKRLEKKVDYTSLKYDKGDN